MRKLTSVIAVLLLFGVVVQAQVQSISGKVTGSNNEPVIGASLLIKGTRSGTTTDASGSFALSVQTHLLLNVILLLFLR